MRKVIFGNCGNEYMVGEVWNMDQKTRDTYAVIGHRFLWLMGNNDIAVMPYKVEQDFLDYMNTLRGTSLTVDQIVLPAGADQESHLLTLDVLSSHAVVEGVKRHLGGDQWQPVPYYFDRSIAWFTEELGLSFQERALGFFRQGGAETFNSKCEFRRFSAAHRIPIADGFVCSSELEVLHAAQALLPEYGRVIVKQDLNASGSGNIVLTLGMETESLGAVETIQISQGDLSAQISALWTRMTGPRNANLVVETYYPDSLSYYSELDVPSDGSRARLLNFGEMRMEPVWIGFEIPCDNITAYQLAEFTAVSAQLAEISRDMGYTGKVNCDAIVTADGKVIFTEINGRLGGCTHVHEAAVALLGEDYGNHYVILTRNKVKSPRFPHMLEALEEAGVLFKQGDVRGVVVLTEDTRRSETLEYMVVANTRAQAEDIERRALSALIKKYQNMKADPVLIM